MSFLSDDGGQTYNLCHYWSNFEIADLDFWRSEAYAKFFDFLETKSGFYYEVRLPGLDRISNKSLRVIAALGRCTRA